MLSRSELASTTKQALLAAGWYHHRITRAAFTGVLVLCYHALRGESWREHEQAFPDLHVHAGTFEQHLDFLQQTCHPIGLDAWRAATTSGAALPSRPALITFDDGYRSVFDIARPMLKARGIPAVVFACTAPILEQRLFWFDAVARESAEARDVADDPLAPMTADQVRILSADGFEIGVHTATHAVLSDCTESEQRRELVSCQRTLADWTGRRPTALAYPFGRRGDHYSHATVSLAMELGFDFAFTTHPRFATADEMPLERSRFVMVADVSAAELAHRIAHAWER